VTYLIAFLMMRRSVPVQILFTIALLALTEFTYRTFPVDGFNQPFIPDHNFGAYVDLLISGELSSGHWVSFNAIPTTAHTMWGVLAGQLIMSNRMAMRKIRILVVAGVIGLILGYSMDIFTPIIKRICTSSFVVVSGGWCLLTLAFSYWLIDVQGISKWSKFFAIVGMNPLFIYLFAEVGGSGLLYKIAQPFVMALFGWFGTLPGEIATGLVTWGMLWYLCYWLYKQRIFIKI